MSSSAQEYAKQAEEAFAKGDFDTAVDLFEKAHEEEAATTKESPVGAIGLGRVAIALGQYEDAMVLFDKVLKTFPKNADALTFRGVVDEAFGRLPAAIQWYEKATKADPKLSIAHYNLGRAFGQMKRFKEAVRELQMATRQDPGNVPFWYALGMVYQESGDGGHAIEAFSECLELNPLFEDGYATFADVLVMNGRDDLAEALLDKATALFPEQGGFHSQLAAIAVRHKNFAKAVEHLKNQAAIEPDNEEVWLNISGWAMLAEDLVTAEEGAKKAVEINPKGWRGYFNLGMIYDAVNLKDQAIDVLRKSVANAPDVWKPFNNLSNLLLEKSDALSWEEALGVLQRALELVPAKEQHIPLYNMALAYFKLGQMEKSKEMALKAVQVGPPGDDTTEDARRFLGNF